LDVGRRRRRARRRAVRVVVVVTVAVTIGDAVVVVVATAGLLVYLMLGVAVVVAVVAADFVRVGCVLKPSVVLESSQSPSHVVYPSLSSSLQSLHARDAVSSISSC
jgi:hypothetical protein